MTKTTTAQPEIPEQKSPLELAEERIKQIDAENAKMVETIYTMLNHYEVNVLTTNGREVGEYIREHLILG